MANRVQKSSTGIISIDYISFFSSFSFSSACTNEYIMGSISFMSKLVEAVGFDYTKHI
jgi:hypothetical protein